MFLSNKRCEFFLKLGTLVTFHTQYLHFTREWTKHTIEDHYSMSYLTIINKKLRLSSCHCTICPDLTK